MKMLNFSVRKGKNLAGLQPNQTFFTWDLPRLQTYSLLAERLHTDSLIHQNWLANTEFTAPVSRHWSYGFW